MCGMVPRIPSRYGEPICVKDPPPYFRFPVPRLRTLLSSPLHFPMTVLVRFIPDDVTVQAEVGEDLLSVAARAGITVPTGCLMGSCHACEVEIEQIGDVCACITAVPPGYTELTINLFTDPTW